MSYLTAVLLTSGVICLSYGINQSSLISTIVGAICLGIYNDIYYHKVWRK